MRTFYLLFFALFSQLPSVAQTISLIPMAGVNLATVRASPVNQFSGSGYSHGASLLTSWQAGVLAEAQVSDKWSFLIGPTYSNKGFISKTGGFWTSGSTTHHKFSYLELPILARLTLGVSKTRFFIEAGGYTAYWLKYSINSTNPAYNNGPTSLNNRIFNKQDYGFIGGFGLKRQAGKGTLVLELRYNHGLRSLYNQKHLPEFQPVRNRVGCLLFSYSIPLK